MPTTPLLGIEELTANQSQKEVTINDGFIALESATNATLAVDFSGGTTVTLSVPEFTRNFIFRCEAATADSILRVPYQVNANPTSRLFTVANFSGHGIEVKTNNGTDDSVIIANGATRLLSVDGENNVVTASEAAIISAFVGLTDVPASYTGAAGRYVMVNGSATGLEFVAQTPLTAENVDDRVAALLQQGANITITYNDGSDTLTIATDALDGEEVDDRVAALLEGGDGITITYDDVTNTLVIEATGTGATIPVEEAGTPIEDASTLNFVGLSVVDMGGGEVRVGGTKLTINTQTSDYTLVAADSYAYVRMNKATAISVTVPPNSSVAFPIGTEIPVRAVGAGQVQVVAGAGVTINSPETLLLRKQGSAASIIKVATDEWDLVGDLELL